MVSIRPCRYTAREERHFGMIKVLSMQATIGIDFLSKTMYLEDRTVRLQLWCAPCHIYGRSAGMAAFWRTAGEPVRWGGAGTRRGRSASAASFPATSATLQWRWWSMMSQVMPRLAFLSPLTSHTSKNTFEPTACTRSSVSAVVTVQNTHLALLSMWATGVVQTGSRS